MKDATTNKVFNLLTIAEIKKMPVFIQKRELDYLQDYACNIDYILNPITSDIIHKNIALIESVLNFKEY